MRRVMAPPARVVAEARAAAVVEVAAAAVVAAAVAPAVVCGAGSGAPVPPGKYTVTLVRREKGVLTTLAGPVVFNILHDPVATTTVADRQANLEFQVQAQKLTRQISAASKRRP